MGRSYRGRRIGESGVVVVCISSAKHPLGTLPATARPGRRYAGAHEWGYGGSGPHQLAYDLLLHASNRPECAERIYRLYAADVVSHLPYDGWTLTRLEIVHWIDAHYAPLIV